MKKIVLSVFAGLFFGVFGGFVIGIFVYPYTFPPAPATEQVVNRAAKTPVASGSFIHANPSDPIHYGQGSQERVLTLGQPHAAYPLQFFAIDLKPEGAAGAVGKGDRVRGPAGRSQSTGTSAA